MKYEKIKNIKEKIVDSIIFNKIRKKYLLIKEKLKTSSKNVKNAIFLL
jgi:hypothetical protein